MESGFIGLLKKSFHPLDIFKGRELIYFVKFVWDCYESVGDSLCIYSTDSCAKDYPFLGREDIFYSLLSLLT